MGVAASCRRVGSVKHGLVVAPPTRVGSRLGKVIDWEINMKVTTMLAAAGLLLATSGAHASIYPYNYAEASYDWVNAYGTDIDAAGGSAELSHPICPHL